jgi:hypothetical protein
MLRLATAITKPSRSPRRLVAPFEEEGDQAPTSCFRLPGNLCARNERVFRQANSNPSVVVVSIWNLTDLWTRASLVPE